MSLLARLLLQLVQQAPQVHLDGGGRRLGRLYRLVLLVLWLLLLLLLALALSAIQPHHHLPVVVAAAAGAHFGARTLLHLPCVLIYNT